ncbi:Ethanolamine utilisation protein EutQ [Bradyrhizobium sp. Rc2d]|nr:Ethanolamine utilisation protein EutQ [Bradyrhizobium sp. Rc2d]
MNAATTEVLHFKSRDMVYEQIFPEAGGYGARSRLLTPANSKTIGASMHTYDGCTIEWTTHYDQVTIVLDGMLRILTGDDYSRVIEATFGDVIWLPNGTPLKYQGEKAKTFTALYPVDWQTRTEAVPKEMVVPEVLHIRRQDIVYEQMFPEAGGYGSRGKLLTPDNSKTIGATMHTYDGTNIEWTAHYDQVTIVVDGTLRILTGDNYSRVIEGKFGDVIRLPNGTPLKYQGEKAKTFTAVFPVDWRAHTEA